jgi:hypothetical protein
LSLADYNAASLRFDFQRRFGVFLRTFDHFCRRKAVIDSISRILILNLRSTINFNCESGSIAFVFTNESSIAVSIENQGFTIFGLPLIDFLC